MTTEEFIKKGYTHLSQDNLNMAIEYFQAALTTDPNCEEAKLNLYLAYKKKDKPQYAKKYHDGEIPTIDFPFSDSLYIKWHKEQVIEKWVGIFNGHGFLNNENEMISCQLFLFPEKGRTKNKNEYNLLISPLNYVNVNCPMPIISTNDGCPVKLQREEYQFSIPFGNQNLGYKTRFTINQEIVLEGSTENVGINALEEMEYEYYNLWADHYLGLWQWEEWHPLTNLRDTVGKKIEILGVDDEMHKISNLLLKKSDSVLPSQQVRHDGLIKEHHPYDDFKRGYCSEIIIDEQDVCFLRSSKLQRVAKYHGEYHVGIWSFQHPGRCPDHHDFVVFGSSNAQKGEVGDIIRFVYGGIGVII